MFFKTSQMNWWTVSARTTEFNTNLNLINDKKRKMFFVWNESRLPWAWNIFCKTEFLSRLWRISFSLGGGCLKNFSKLINSFSVWCVCVLFMVILDIKFQIFETKHFFGIKRIHKQKQPEKVMSYIRSILIGICIVTIVIVISIITFVYSGGKCWLGICYLYFWFSFSSFLLFRLNDFKMKWI